MLNNTPALTVACGDVSWRRWSLRCRQGDQACSPRQAWTVHRSISETLYCPVMRHASSTGAALVKYGSLLTDALFHPNTAVAVGLVFGPPLLYAVYLLNRGR
jgi:hypothetical protein